MSRQATGQLTHWKRADGTTAWGCRFRHAGKRRHELLGSTLDGMTARKARTALADLMAAVRAGRYVSPEDRVAEPAPREVPDFHHFATDWFDRLCEEGGRNGDGLSERSVADLRDWRLREHVLPFFADYRLDEIGVEDVDRFRIRLKRSGRLSNASINKMVATVASIMEVAVEYEWAASNPAKGRRRRLKTEKPDRTYLTDPVQVVALLDAASDLDDRGRGVRYRRPLLATLVLAGPRIGEALDLKWSDVDLDGTGNGNVVPLKGREPTLHIDGTKTANAQRTLRLAPALRDELVALRAEVGDASPQRFVFATRTGNRFSETNIRNRILRPAIEAANERLLEEGHEPIMDGITPHSLRRTFASMLAKRGEDPATMMGQLGHATAEFTFSVYAKASDADREAWEALWQGASGQAEGNSEPEADSGADRAEAV